MAWRRLASTPAVSYARLWLCADFLETIIVAVDPGLGLWPPFVSPLPSHLFSHREVAMDMGSCLCIFEQKLHFVTLADPFFTARARH